MKRNGYIVFYIAAILAVGKSYAQAPDITYNTPLVYTVGVPITPALPTNNGGAIPATIFAQVTTFAGNGTAGNTNGIGAGATFNNPKGVALDAAGNVYVADSGNNLIRKITPAGLVTTFAGSGADGSADGPGPLASFSEPTGIAVDKAGFIYVTDRKSHIIRKISPAGIVTTIAGRPGVAGFSNAQGSFAFFNNPTGIAVDAAGYLYVADYTNNMIRGIAPDGTVRTIAGSGAAGNGVTTDADKKGNLATFRSPASITVTPDGSAIYVGEDTYIRKIDADGNVVTIAGGFFGGSIDGTFKSALVTNIGGLTIDAASTLFFGETGSNKVRRMDLAGSVGTIAGFSRGFVDGTGTAASFNQDAGVAVNLQGEVFVADAGNNAIRKVITTGYYVSPALPPGLTLDSRTGIITGTPTQKMQASNYTIIGYNTAGRSAILVNIEVRAPGLIKQTITFPTLPAKKEGDLDFEANASSTNSTIPITYTSSDITVATISDGKIHIIGPGTTTITAFQNGNVDYDDAVPISHDLVVAEVPKVYKYPTITQKGAPILLPLTSAGNFKAVLGDIATITADPAEILPVVLLSNNTFTCENVGPQTINIAAGYGPDPANPLNAEFNAPSNLTYDAKGNIFIADPGNFIIRELSNAGRVSTFAGSAAIGYQDGKSTIASFSRGLLSITTDAAGNIYVCDVLNAAVRKITPAGDVSTFASDALKALNGGKSVNAQSIAVDGLNNIFIADKTRIYQVSNDGSTAVVFAGNGTVANVDGVGTAASLSGIAGLTFDRSGNLYVSTSDNNYVNTVKKITPDGTVKTLLTITAQSVHFMRLVVDSKGNVFISSSDDKIYLVANGNLSTFAGSVKGDLDGIGSGALFNNPQGIAIDGADNLYIADSDNHKIKKITPKGVVTTIAGNGQPGHVDNTRLSNAQTTPVPVIVTSPLLFQTTYADVSLPAAASCVALMPDYAKDAKAISYCTPNITYTQSPLPGTPLPFGQPVTITLTANDDLSPYDKATVSFKVTAAAASQPTIVVNPIIILLCDGIPLKFTATVTNAGSNPTYQWKVNDVAVFSGSAEFTGTKFINGDKVTCVVTNNDGCAPVSATSAAASIAVQTPVTVSLSIAPSVSGPVCPGNAITFTATAGNLQVGTSPVYQWRINNTFAGSDSPTFTTLALQNGDIVTCTLITSGNCVINPVAQSAGFVAQVKTETECSIVINNTFTPNGDGINDLWNLPVLQSYPNCRVLVYTRYGKQVFQSIGYSKAWNGEYQGKLLPAGTYYYVIDTKTGDAPLSGSVTILR